MKYASNREINLNKQPTQAISRQCMGVLKQDSYYWHVGEGLGEIEEIPIALQCFLLAGVFIVTD